VPTSQPTASRAFDLCVLAAGAVSTAWLAAGTAIEPVHVAMFLVIPLIIVIARFPLALDRHGGAIEIGFDSCVLVFLACSVSPGAAVLLWSVGVVVTQATNDKRLESQIFNMGIGMLSGAISIFAITSLGNTQELVSLRQLLAVSAGCVAYFVFDFVLSAVSVGLSEQTSVWKEIFHRDAYDATACFVATASLGYFAAVVVQSMPGWSVGLLAVPLASLLVASRAVTRGREHARRLGVLFAAAARAQTLHTAQDVFKTLGTEARELLREDSVDVRRTAPRSLEIGAPFLDGHHEYWIVSRVQHRARATITADQQGLEALAALAGEALGRLRLTTQMSHLAHHDVLTALPNRALFLDRAEHAMLMARRRNSRLAVLFCDLDGFKRVNDRLGHATGDELLVEVARRIRTCLRDSDTVARLGGDEFAILLEDLEGEGRVQTACSRVLAVLRERIALSEHLVSVSTSIGVAYSETAETAEGLLRNADMAMYQAKAQGKDRCSTYEPALGRARVRKLELVEALRNAIEQRQVEVAYQPVVELHSRAIVGVEALARWSYNGVPIAPDLFIGAAEDSGLVTALGDLMFDLVLADAPRLRDAAGATFEMGVNISAQQLRADNFVRRVTEVDERLGDVSLLLEVTERDIVPNDSTSLDTMSQLAARGIRFAVDDFGIGFSSIGYLGQLPVHVLKTDRSFSATIDEHERACKLLRSMVVMGEALGLDLVIEGVERPSQVDHLIRHVGAPTAQGYLLHRPMNADALEQVLLGERIRASEPAALSSSAARLI